MNQAVIVRTAAANDIAAIKPLKEQIHSIHVEGNPKHFCKLKEGEIEAFFKELMLRENTRVLVALMGEKTAGYIVLMLFTRNALPGHNSRNVLLVDEICVDRQMRGKGVGTALMQSAKEVAQELGANSIELGVWEFNRDAIAFYEHMGMKIKISRYGMEL